MLFNFSEFLIDLLIFPILSVSLVFSSSQESVPMISAVSSVMLKSA